jgi:hypothetical protein
MEKPKQDQSQSLLASPAPGTSRTLPVIAVTTSTHIRSPLSRNTGKNRFWAKA